MDNLFDIPELVAAILAAGNVDRDLRRCLLVNRRFSHEAARILWQRCGVDFWQRAPTVHDLANIAARNVQRAQYYADFIHELSFIRHGETWPRIDEREQWHDHLLSLRFPTLEHFTSDGRTGDHLESDYRKAAGPFYDFFPSRATLFWHILSCSPKLKSIDLALDEPSSFQSVEEEAVEFIKSAPALSSLSLALIIYDSEFPIEAFWPLGVVSSLAELPAFRKLEGQSLTAELLQNLPRGSFPALRELATGYAGSIAVLLQSFPYLSALDLRLLEPVNEGLGRFASLSFLTSLSLHFAEGSTISGPELIAVARGCPHLTEVKLPPGSVLIMGDPCPHGKDLNDATIEQFARSLEKLDMFCFGLEERSAITHQAIISLARHCPNLGYLYIAANISMPELIWGLKEVRDVPLPFLTFMRLYLPENVEHEYEGADELAGQLVRKIAPGLCEFSIDDGSASDTVFQNHVDILTG